MTNPVDTASSVKGPKSELLDMSHGMVSLGRSPIFPYPQYRMSDQYKTVYFDEGTGPTMVFVHGLGGNVTHFEFILQDLGRDHRIVGLDLVGFGASLKPPCNYNIEFLADHLIAFLDHRGIKRTTLVGHSLGATVCLAASLKRPDLVESLILIGAAGLAPLPLWMRWGSHLVLHERLLFFLLFRLHNWILDNVFVDPPEKNEYVKHFRVSSLNDEPGFPNLLPQLKDFARVSTSICKDVVRCNYAPRLHELTMPVLALWGDNDKLVKLPSIEDALKLIPRLRRRVVLRSGHLTMVERPKEVVEMIREFLSNPPLPV